MRRQAVDDQAGSDKWLSRLVRRGAATSPAASADVCLDAEVLAAWAEGRLARDAQAIAEQHVAGCARCLSVRAAMERAAPAEVPLQPPRAWVRWLVPLTAAATAVAIWVAIPEQQEVPVSREVTSAPTAPAAVPSEPLAQPDAPPPPAAPAAEAAQTLAAQPASARQAESARQDAGAAAKASGASAENRARGSRGFSDAASLEKQSARESDAGASRLARDVVAPVAPPPAAPQAQVGSLSESVAITGQRANAPPSIVEAVSASDPMIRWRIVAAADVERSLDGGQTWTATARPPAAVSAIRVTDALAATVTTASGTRFFTTDGGKTWAAVQEKPAAPF